MVLKVKWCLHLSYGSVEYYLWMDCCNAQLHSVVSPRTKRSSDSFKNGTSEWFFYWRLFFFFNSALRRGSPLYHCYKINLRPNKKPHFSPQTPPLWTFDQVQVPLNILEVHEHAAWCNTWVFFPHGGTSPVLKLGTDQLENVCNYTFGPPFYEAIWVYLEH